MFQQRCRNAVMPVCGLYGKSEDHLVASGGIVTAGLKHAIFDQWQIGCAAIDQTDDLIAVAGYKKTLWELGNAPGKALPGCAFSRGKAIRFYGGYCIQIFGTDGSNGKIKHPASPNHPAFPGEWQRYRPLRRALPLLDGPDGYSWRPWSNGKHRWWPPR